MAPHDKLSDGLRVMVVDVGVHSIHQECDNEFEIRLLTSSQDAVISQGEQSSWFTEKSKAVNQKEAAKPKKRVSFNDDVMYKEIPHKSMISDEDKARLWVNVHDWQATQNEKQRLTRAIAFGHMQIENPEHRSMLRGFECLVARISSRRRQNISDARSFVVREQFQARLDQTDLNWDRVAWCYGNLVRNSRELACRQGLEDYYTALEVDAEMSISVLV